MKDRIERFIFIPSSIRRNFNEPQTISVLYNINFQHLLWHQNPKQLHNINHHLQILLVLWKNVQPNFFYGLTLSYRIRNSRQHSEYMIKSFRSLSHDETSVHHNLKAFVQRAQRCFCTSLEYRWLIFIWLFFHVRTCILCAALSCFFY